MIYTFSLNSFINFLRPKIRKYWIGNQLKSEISARFTSSGLLEIPEFNANAVGIRNLEHSYQFSQK